MTKPEDQARQRIDALLKGAGWSMQHRDQVHLHAGRGIAVQEFPLAEQHRIVAEVEIRFSVLEELEKEVSTNLQRAERLRQSILEQAFSGKLVQQNADAESGVWPDLPLATEEQGIYKSKI